MAERTWPVDNHINTCLHAQLVARCPAVVVHVAGAADMVNVVVLHTELAAAL